METKGEKRAGVVLCFVIGIGLALVLVYGGRL